MEILVDDNVLVFRPTSVIILVNKYWKSLTVQKYDWVSVTADDNQEAEGGTNMIRNSNSNESSLTFKGINIFLIIMIFAIFRNLEFRIY